MEYDSAEEANVQILAPPDPAPKSAYDLDNFHTLLLPSIENKPLDSSALQVRAILIALELPSHFIFKKYSNTAKNDKSYKIGFLI